MLYQMDSAHVYLTKTAKDIKNCDAGYTSMFHEATTNVKRKQLDVLTRYGSNERKQVVSK